MTDPRTRGIDPPSWEGPDRLTLDGIALRNPYVDPLSFLQVDLLRRKRDLPDDAPPETRAEQDRLLTVSINGVAAGMRSSG